MPTLVVGGGLINPTSRIDLSGVSWSGRCDGYEHLHSILSDLRDFDFVKDGDNIGVIVVRALDLIEQLCFASIDRHQPIPILLLRNDKFATDFDLHNRKCKI